MVTTRSGLDAVQEQGGELSRPDSGPVTLGYIAGAGHSGSTMLAMVLNTHPAVFTVGEMHAPRSLTRKIGPIKPKNTCSCGELIDDCPFMLEMARRLKPQGFDLQPRSWTLEYRVQNRPRVDRLLIGNLCSDRLESIREGVFRLVPSYRRWLDRLDRHMELFVRTALDYAGKSVFVDASKHPNRIHHLRRIAGFRLKVLHLVRDPRGYVCSLLKQWPDPVAYARDWARCNRNVENHLAACPPGTGMFVRYESLCSDPAAMLAEIGRFLGVGPISVPTDFRATEHHLSAGNKSRHATDQRVDIQLDERWRTELSEADRAIVTRIAGPLARKYGYDI